ncbi:putative membrane protein [Vibrio sp. HENC-03]|nr:putative membrane protein [Vibrio sp. HENC-03]
MESSVAVSALRVIPFMVLIPFVFAKYNYSRRNQIDQKSR